MHRGLPRRVWATEERRRGVCSGDTNSQDFDSCCHRRKKNEGRGLTFYHGGKRGELAPNI